MRQLNTIRWIQALQTTHPRPFIYTMHAESVQYLMVIVLSVTVGQKSPGWRQFNFENGKSDYIITLNLHMINILLWAPLDATANLLPNCTAFNMYGNHTSADEAK